MWDRVPLFTRDQGRASSYLLIANIDFSLELRGEILGSHWGETRSGCLMTKTDVVCLLRVYLFITHPHPSIPHMSSHRVTEAEYMITLFEYRARPVNWYIYSPSGQGQFRKTTYNNHWTRECLVSNGCNYLVNILFSLNFNIIVSWSISKYRPLLINW